LTICEGQSSTATLDCPQCSPAQGAGPEGRHSRSNSSDNIAMLCWQYKGATSTKGPAAHLLHLQALHQSHHFCIHLFDYIPESATSMSNGCIQCWGTSDSQYFAHFDLVFPKNKPWRLFKLHKPMRSALSLALLMNISKPVLPFNESSPWTTIEPPGTHSSWRTILTHTSGIGTNPSLSFKYLENDTMVDGCPLKKPLTGEKRRAQRSQRDTRVI
jgi:hypothetical protein